MPFISGMFQSVITMATSALRRSVPSRPLLASTISVCPSLFRVLMMIRRIVDESSTTRKRIDASVQGATTRVVRAQQGGRVIDAGGADLNG